MIFAAKKINTYRFLSSTLFIATIFFNYKRKAFSKSTIKTLLCTFSRRMIRLTQKDYIILIKFTIKRISLKNKQICLVFKHV